MDRYTTQLSTNFSYFWAICASVMSYLSLEKMVLVVGMLTAIGTFFINWYYRHKEFKHKMKIREQRRDQK